LYVIVVYVVCVGDNGRDVTIQPTCVVDLELTLWRLIGCRPL